MARPSKIEERTKEIVDATVRTMSKFGYAGTTLDRIAAEAGLARGHIRHFVGNRQDLIRQTARQYYFDPDNGSSILPAETTSVRAVIDFLFSDAFIGEREDYPVVFGFIEASRTDPEIAAILLQAYQGTEKELEALLVGEYPRVKKGDIEQVAFAIVALAIHNIFLYDISIDAQRTSLARATALHQLDRLGVSKGNSR